MKSYNDGFKHVQIATDWHRVSYDTENLNRDCQDWLSTSLEGGFFIAFGDIYLEKEEDVILFKLRFL